MKKTKLSKLSLLTVVLMLSITLLSNFATINVQAFGNEELEGDTVIIKSLDRLGRNYEQMKDEWKDLSDRGIRIRVLDSPLLDTSKYDDDLMGKFVSDIVFNVLSFCSENERKNIKQRQAEGIAIAKARGVKFGRPEIKYPEQFENVYNDWKCGRIKGVEAMRILGLKKSTFYKKCKQYKYK